MAYGATATRKSTRPSDRVAKAARKLENLATLRRDLDPTQRGHMLNEALKRYTEIWDKESVKRVSEAIKTNNQAEYKNLKRPSAQNTDNYQDRPQAKQRTSVDKETSETIHAANTHFFRGCDFRSKGKYEDAEKEYENSANLLNKIGDKFGSRCHIEQMLWMWLAAAEEAQKRNEYETARKRFSHALEKAGQFKDHEYLKNISNKLKVLEEAEKRHRDADAKRRSSFLYKLSEVFS